MPNIQLARNLKYLRLAYGLTQDDLGAFLNIFRLGVDRATENRIYLTKEETEFISKVRTLAPEDRQIALGFIDSRSKKV